MPDPTFLIWAASYAAIGALGGLLYALHYRIFFKEPAEAGRRIGEGAGAGLALYLLILSGLIPEVPPDSFQLPLAMLLALFWGFWGTEIIEQLSTRFRPGSAAQVDPAVRQVFASGELVVPVAIANAPSQVLEGLAERGFFITPDKYHVKIGKAELEALRRYRVVIQYDPEAGIPPGEEDVV